MATVARKMELPAKSIKLPAARLDSSVSTEKVLCSRRSISEFSAQPLELSQVSQLAWAAQGLTGPGDLLIHEVVSLLTADIRRELSRAALDQTSITQAAAIFAVSAVYERIRSKYGDRGIRYAHIEAGHAAQNLLLQAVALDLGAVLVGAFDDSKVRRTLGMSKDEQPLYLIPVGKP